MPHYETDLFFSDESEHCISVIFASASFGMSSKDVAYPYPISQSAKDNNKRVLGTNVLCSSTEKSRQRQLYMQRNNESFEIIARNQHMEEPDSSSSCSEEDDDEESEDDCDAEDTNSEGSTEVLMSFLNYGRPRCRNPFARNIECMKGKARKLRTCLLARAQVLKTSFTNKRATASTHRAPLDDPGPSCASTLIIEKPRFPHCFARLRNLRRQ